MNFLRIVVIGKDYTGKSSLVCARPFDRAYSPTIGVDYVVSMVVRDGAEISLAFWDLSGQGRFYPIVMSYVRDCSVIVFCYSAIDISSFREIDEKYRGYLKYGHKEVILVATKIDSPDVHPDYEKWGHDFSVLHKCSFVKTSSKTNEGVKEFFDLCSFFYLNPVKKKSRNCLLELFSRFNP